MIRSLLTAALSIAIISISYAQKKPIDHGVYDQWQSISERVISNNGNWFAYTVGAQEGDGYLVIANMQGATPKTIQRGYATVFTNDNRFAICKIKAPYLDPKIAKNKKKPTDTPKDSMAIIDLVADTMMKLNGDITYKIPEKQGAWLAMLLSKAPADTSLKTKKPVANAAIDSLKKVIDSLNNLLQNTSKKRRSRDDLSADVLAVDPPAPVIEGRDLELRNTTTGSSKIFKYVNEYYFNETGKTLVMEITANKDDTLSTNGIVWHNLETGISDTIFRKANDINNYVLDEEGLQLAFMAERDSSSKALQKFYQLFYYKTGADSALKVADRFTTGVPKGSTISTSKPSFSNNGSRLYFATNPIPALKDTTIVESEMAKLDIWHYNDDYLQPQQLKQASSELSKTYLAVWHISDRKLIQLASSDFETFLTTDQGDGDYALGVTSKGSRIQSQWTGRVLQTAYLVNINDGSRKLIAEKLKAGFTPSPSGKFIFWYDPAFKQFFTYEISSGLTKNITAKIPVKLYNDEDDHPDDPPSFGTGGWFDNDSALLINDKYDIWKVDPTGKIAPVNITGYAGSKNKTVLRYVRTEWNERFVKTGQTIILTAFNRINKYAGFYSKQLGAPGEAVLLTMTPNSYGPPLKARASNVFLVTKADINESGNVYSSTDLKTFTVQSSLNPQQKEYNWLSVELMKWKMFDGKQAEGLLYKPENFDPSKKYPVIFYFYERNADDLYKYKAPAPSASTINIPYFVSNGYLVFDPNIYYKTGQPGEDAYNSVISAAKFLSKMPFVDSTKMAIQGQSWGGYQVAYLVTRTNMFKAASAGAPVANMTSAYGGIRWGSGVNRQFQYEKTQSRIGATLWERPDLYIKNSPLFTANKVNTPLLLMHNDADGAVPWYQSIEYFTALRRLGKKVWMLQYNGEDHNLVQRKNRKDLSIRLGQFFDYYLKGAKPARWIIEGLPATEKGKTWATETDF